MANEQEGIDIETLNPENEGIYIPNEEIDTAEDTTVEETEITDSNVEGNETNTNVDSDKELLNPLKRASVLDVEKLGRLEDEVSKVQGEYKLMEDKYGIDVLNLTLVKGYIRSLFDNPNVCNYLKIYEPDIFHQFEKIIELENINIKNESFL